MFFNRKLARQLEREAQLLEREYHLVKLYTGMVKGASRFMTKHQEEAWLKLNDPKKMNGCISLFYGSNDWAQLLPDYIETTPTLSTLEDKDNE